MMHKLGNDIGPGNDTMAQNRGPQNGHGGSCDSAKLGSASAAVAVIAVAISSRTCSIKAPGSREGSSTLMMQTQLTPQSDALCSFASGGALFEVTEGTWRRPQPVS